MKLTKDEQMLDLLYGDGTKTGLEKVLIAMQETLQPDEMELKDMTGQLLAKLRRLSEEKFRKLTEEIHGK